MPHRAIAKAASTHPFLVSLVILLIIVIPGFWRIQQAINNAERALAEAQHNAIVACTNDNERAKAGKLLWTFILGTPPQEPPRNRAEARFRKNLQHWINDLYNQNDCNDLDHKYALPDPPTLDELRRLRHNNNQSRR